MHPSHFAPPTSATTTLWGTSAPYLWSDITDGWLLKQSTPAVVTTLGHGNKSCSIHTEFFISGGIHGHTASVEAVKSAKEINWVYEGVDWASVTGNAETIAYETKEHAKKAEVSEGTGIIVT